MWQIIYYTGETFENENGKKNFETREILITDEQYKQVQEAIKEGDDFIIMENKPTIKRSLIASITQAGKDIFGNNNLMLKSEDRKQITGDIKQLEPLKDYIKRTHNDFYKKMGWEK